MSFEINLLSGEKKKLLTGGKYCPEDIVVSAEKPVPVEEKDVNFYDYDGTCLYAYTLAEAQALTELPPAPKHDGLVFQEWNWDLDDVRALNQTLEIGANYITDDGKTRLYISIDHDNAKVVPIYIYQSVSNGVEIDWGDGSEVETIGGTGYVTTTHAYDTQGEYVIKLRVTSGDLHFGNNTEAQGVFGSAAFAKTILRKAEIGLGITTLGRGAFADCRALKIITIPNNVTDVAAKAFQNNYALLCVIFGKSFYTSATYLFYDCTSLRLVSFGKSMECITNSMLRNCYSLSRVSIYSGSISSYTCFNYGLHNAYSLKKFELSDKATVIQANSFYANKSLTSFVVKHGITTIGANAFYGCDALRVLRFLPTTPPTVAKANAFTNIPTDCIVEVPNLAAYQAATNYASIAAQMVEV